jgi:hypothetical protein
MIQEGLMKFYFTFICVLITLIGCKKDSNEHTINYAYLGGEIINPNTNFVVLSKEDAIIDTVKLDARNRFLYKIEGLQEGFYTFSHGGEFQLVLLEPEDSLLFRLNTLDFDESLVYSGKGNKKNNYFINEFLQNEEEEKYILKLCQLDGATFQKRVDSLKASKIDALETFSNKYNPSDLFLKIARANIDFSYYFSKEVYPFGHFGNNKAAIIKSLPDNFYDYRNEINYNDDFLSSHHNYNKFLRYNLSNLSLTSHDTHDHNACYDRKSLCYNLDRLKLIDSLITNPTIKDELLYHFTMGYLSKSKNEENNKMLLKSFLEKSGNEASKNKIARYVNSINRIKEGEKLPEIHLLNYKKDVVKINKLIDSPTVVSFWSHTYYEHFKESHYKLKELKIKYPEVKFLMVNIDAYGIEKSRRLLEGSGFNHTNEFKLENPEQALEILAVYPMTKTLLIDKNKKIANSNTNIFSVQFEEQLLGLINK